MTARIPDNIRNGLRQKLWEVADQLDWLRLNWYEKSARYEAWSKDKEVGVLLSNYMDHRKIRVYIKDTIMKGYVRSRQADFRKPFAVSGIEHDAEIANSWERPHGRHLTDGRVIAWGNADDWKMVITTLHERAWGIVGARPYAAVLMDSNGKFSEISVRRMVEDAGKKLMIEKLIWLA
jgi:hypothetical protein